MVIGWSDIAPLGLEVAVHIGRLGMGVHKEYRGQGIGSKLITKALEHARKIGLEKVELEVFEKNRGAVALYRKLGFVEEGKLIKSKKLDGEYDNSFYFGLFL